MNLRRPLVAAAARLVGGGKAGSDPPRWHPLSAHVEHILGTLDMERRAQIAAWVTAIDETSSAPDPPHAFRSSAEQRRGRA